MKRKILLFFLFALLLAVTVSAADTYRLEDLGLSIDIPSEYVVITRHMSPDDPALALFDMTADQVETLLEDSNIYLDVLNEDENFEFNLTMIPNAVKNMNQFDEESLDSMQQTLQEQYEGAGLAVDKIEHLTQDRAVFYRTECSAESNVGTTQLRLYYTVYNYQAITITLRYQGDALPAQYETFLKDAIASMRFDDDGSAPAEESEPYDFYDSDTGVWLTVPAGWTEAQVDPSLYTEEQQKMIKATFSCESDPTAAIVYGSYDVMEELPGLFKMFADRSMIDQEAVSIDDLAEAMPYEVKSKRVETIGDREFYVFEINGTMDVGGNEMEYAETDVIRIENGYEYVFEFAGTSDHARYADFLSMVESARIPAAAAAEPEAPTETPAAVEPAAEPEAPETPAAPAAPAAPGAKKKGIPILPILLGLAAIGVVAGLIARGKKKRAQQPAAYAVPVEPAAPAAPAKRVCASCGADLGPDDTVCPYCGTKAE